MRAHMKGMTLMSLIGSEEEAKSKGLDGSSLFGALKDAIEASIVSANYGKYFNQASIYGFVWENFQPCGGGGSKGKN